MNNNQTYGKLVNRFMLSKPTYSANTRPSALDGMGGQPEREFSIGTIGCTIAPIEQQIDRAAKLRQDLAEAEAKWWERECWEREMRKIISYDEQREIIKNLVNNHDRSVSPVELPKYANPCGEICLKKTDVGNIVNHSDSQKYTTMKDSNIYVDTYVFPSSHNPVVTIHNDGNVEIAHGTLLSEASEQFWTAVANDSPQKLRDRIISLESELEQTKKELGELRLSTQIEETSPITFESAEDAYERAMGMFK